MAGSITEVLNQIKSDIARHLEPSMILAICERFGHKWRERILDPVTTIHAFLLQILFGNTACDHVPHLVGRRFTGSAYGLARARIPLGVFQELVAGVCETLHATLDQAALWLGHRVWLEDGSAFSMPDTPELQAAFGQPSGQARGCGFPVAHLLTLFHAGTGLLLKTILAPMRTHDMAQASQMRPEMRAGDVLLADRGFSSFAHLCLLLRVGIHAVFRLHQKQITSFRAGRLHAPARRRYSWMKGVRGIPRSRWIKRLGRLDQLVEYFKPTKRPKWMSEEDYAGLPESIVVRELRFHISHRGCRTRLVTLVTTLLDPDQYPARELIALYEKRWHVETNLRHLKQTMHMDVLRTKTVNGVTKELAMFVLAYNLVRLVMIKAAKRQKVPVERISFIDALRWLCHTEPGEPLCNLIVLPHRPHRVEPRVRKRRPKEFPLMKQPRDELRKALLQNGEAA